MNEAAFPYSTWHDPIPFKEVLEGKYPVSENPFKNSKVAKKCIQLLGTNSINSYAIIGGNMFVTYKGSIARKEGFPYHFLQFEGVTRDRTKFLLDSFNTVDYRNGLYLFRKVHLDWQHSRTTRF